MPTKTSTSARKPATRSAKSSAVAPESQTPQSQLPSTRPKDRSPAFPARVIRFSKTSDAYELMLFEAGTVELEYQGWLAVNLGAIRVIKSVKDLAEVPMGVLLDIFNKTRAEKPLDRFRDRETAENRVFEVLYSVQGVFTPWTEKKLMAEAATKTEAKTKAEAKAQEKAEAKKIRDDKKAADKLAKEKTRAAKSEGGVIGTIKSVLLSKEGGSIDEIVAVLVKKFPERGADGMRSTVKIQTSRLKDKIGKIANAEIVNRGRVYKAESAGEISGKRVEAAKEVEPAKAAEPTKAAETKAAKAETPKAAAK